ncbi:MAG: pirin-like C-terminal cupin domain-containing protein [Asticcacaulis sp.]
MVLFGHADPIDEPIVAHGPFVMNTVEEIHAAYRDYQAANSTFPWILTPHYLSQRCEDALRHFWE